MSTLPLPRQTQPPDLQGRRVPFCALAKAAVAAHHLVGLRLRPPTPRPRPRPRLPLAHSSSDPICGAAAPHIRSALKRPRSVSPTIAAFPCVGSGSALGVASGGARGTYGKRGMTRATTRALCGYRVRFVGITVHATFTATEYDRAPAVPALYATRTCPATLAAVIDEVNAFKRDEMVVHKDSAHRTVFHVVALPAATKVTFEKANQQMASISDYICTLQAKRRLLTARRLRAHKKKKSATATNSMPGARTG